MKNTLLLSLFLFFWAVSTAQVRPEAYIAKLPPVPGNVCSDDNKQEKDEFIAKLNEIGEQLQNELERRHENYESTEETNKTKMMSNAVKQSGISPELIQQLMALEKQSKGATGDQKQAYDAQRKAITDQMIQQKMNISMGELESLKKMDMAGKRAWATAYSTEKNAEVMADPRKYQDMNAKSMEKFKLQARQKQLGDSLKAQQNKYMSMFRELDENKDGKKILAKIDSIRKVIYDMYTEATKHETSPDQHKLEQLRDDMRATKKSYCALLSPMYADVLEKYKLFVQSSMSAYYRFEKLTNEMNASQTGVDMNPEPGEFGLGQISGYLNRLKEAYKYNLYGPEDLTIG